MSYTHQGTPGKCWDNILNTAWGKSFSNPFSCCNTQWNMSFDNICSVLLMQYKLQSHVIGFDNRKRK